MKSIKNLLIPFIILIALVICAVVYFVVDNIRNKEPSDTSDGMVDVLYFNTADVASVTVYNGSTGFTSVVNCSADSNNMIRYEYSGDDADPSVAYSQSKLATYVSNLTYYCSNRKVSSAGNYAEYGLEAPSYTVTIKPVNGSETAVFLGNKSPDGKSCYMYVAGSKDIYLVTDDKLFQSEKNAMNFLDTQVLNIAYSDIKTVHFDRTDDGLSLDAVITVNDSGLVTYDIVKPYNHKASTYFENLIDSVIHLDVSEYIDIENDALNKYGLDRPAYHFVISLNNGGKTEVFFSRKIGASYYGYVSGTDNYFMLTEYQLDGVDLNETVLIDPYVCYCYVKDISSITGTYGDKSFKFAVDVPSGKNIMSDGALVTLDGRNAQIADSSGRSYCSILFESIACIKIGGVETDAVVDTSSDPALTLTFIGKDHASTVYEFYTRNSDSYYVYKNGEYMSFYVYSAEIFNDGGNNTYNYGYWKAYELLNEAISGSISGIYDMPGE